MIIKNASAFSFDFLPPAVLHRDREMKEIVMHIKLFLNGAKQHLFLYGPQGTGKTTLARFIAEKGDALYLDAKIFNTKTLLLSEIANRLKYPLPRRGFRVEEAIAEWPRDLKPLAVFIDEADSFPDKDFLYLLAKSNLNLMLILISNMPSLHAFFSKLSGMFSTIEFKRYSPMQLKDILRQRAELGLVKNSWNEEVLGKIAGFAAKHKGNARAALLLLFKSALNAEMRESPTISVGDVEEAKKALLKDLLSYDEGSLNEYEKAILEQLLNAQYLTIDEISSKLPIGERMVRNYLKHLEERGFITREEVIVGKTKKFIYRIKLKV